MPTPEDFGRLADLLGDACEAAGPPAGRVGESSSAAPSYPGPSAQRSAQGSRQETRGDMARAVASAWPAVAGAEVAANATPVRLKNGRLTVSTSSSVWAQTLQYMSADLAVRLNEHLGTEAVSEIVFRHAGWEERPCPSERDRSDPVGPGCATAAGLGGLSMEQKQALAGVEELDLPPQIKDKVMCAMRASFVRAQRGSVR